MAEKKTTEQTAGAGGEKGSLLFKLEYPTRDGGAGPLPYRTPWGRDMRLAMRQSGFARYSSLIETLFEMDEAALDRLDGRDYARLIQLIDGFFEPPQRTSTM